ncbi:hypothetical protein JYT72_00600 [Crocinitomix catalasitica]|nr:hypothetical protein [Crocinitomix catalasitica]
MREDIEIPIVENINVAVVRELNEEKTAEVFNVYLLNLRDSEIDNVLVSSAGYGENKTTGEQIKTSALRHFIGTMAPRSFAKIEPIVEDVFGINNEYWVSFFEGKKIYDKKFIFLAESITEENFINVPLIEAKGVLI